MYYNGDFSLSVVQRTSMKPWREKREEQVKQLPLFLDNSCAWNEGKKKKTEYKEKKWKALEKIIKHDSILERTN